MLFTNGAVGWQKACGPALRVFPDGAVCLRSILCRIAKVQVRKFLLAGFLVLLPVCLTLGFVAFIVLETFGLDPDLRPFGTEDFEVDLQKLFAAGLPSVRVFSGLAAMHCFVAPAGAHLILRHRARSALATDNSTVPIASNVAEPWRYFSTLPRCSAMSFLGIRALAATHADERGRQMRAYPRARCLT
jgi:hypothetical protein